jgi:hypothetical protein
MIHYKWRRDTEASILLSLLLNNNNNIQTRVYVYFNRSFVHIFFVI